MIKKNYIIHPDYKDVKDIHFMSKIEYLVEKFDIKTIVETGTFMGDSLVYFAQMVPKVYSIEISDYFIEYTTKKLIDFGLNNAEILKGNSSIELLKLMHKIDAEKTIFFLDAHNRSYWPLLDEIEVISRNKGIIVIHDAQVPDHPEFGYDTWNNSTLNYDYVKDALFKWSKTHRVEYNKISDSPNPRGCMFVYPI